MLLPPAQNALSHEVWNTRYRVSGETSLADTWSRVARAAAAAEPMAQAEWERSFRDILADFRFLPAGRILANAGVAGASTLANCFVMGPIEDSVAAVFGSLQQSALTIHSGGGIGCDFSTLAPRGHSEDSCGPVAWMTLWDAMCATLSAAAPRRGAMMGSLRCDHPDIEQFVTAKLRPGTLLNFNLSVGVTDAFMAAVEADSSWELRFPGSGARTNAATGTPEAATVRRIAARALWKTITDAAYGGAEPGLLFIDRINALNNLYYCERIATTNPCGEAPLPPFGACVLGSVNLPAFVRGAFSAGASLDLGQIGRVVDVAVRFLDDAIEISRFPLPEQQSAARATRRIGIGLTGLADALMMLGLQYDSEAGRGAARSVLACIRDTAYLASTRLAAQRGSFPLFDRDAFLAGPYANALPREIRDAIASSGLRNSHLLSVAPAGSISLLANNVSSGVEPIFAAEAERQVRDSRGATQAWRIPDFAIAEWRRAHRESLPPTFVTAAELPAAAHLEMVAAVQPYVDGSVSKTVNVGADATSAMFAAIYRRAYDLGLKGCTAFRPGPVRGAVLSEIAPTVECVRSTGAH